MQIKGLVDWPFVVPNAPVKLGDVVVGRVVACELAPSDMTSVTLELDPAQVPVLNDESDPRGYSLVRRDWEPL